MADPRLIDRARDLMARRRNEKLAAAIARVVNTPEASAWRSWCSTPMGQRFSAWLEEEFFRGAFDGENADQAVGARGVIEALRRLRLPPPDVKP